MFDAALTSNKPSLEIVLTKVRRILERAEKCLYEQVAEPGWNEQVHSRVLGLALRDQAEVSFWNMYASYIIPYPLRVARFVIRLTTPPTP
jgi:hypothetical protein